MTPELKAALETVAPGPWGYDGIYVRDARRRIVATPGSAVDARLIKTAPRLLVAAIECAELLAAIFEAMGGAPEGGLDKLDNARLAVEEATGTGRWALDVH